MVRAASWVLWLALFFSAGRNPFSRADPTLSQSTLSQSTLGEDLLQPRGRDPKPHAQALEWETTWRDEGDHPDMDTYGTQPNVTSGPAVVAAPLISDIGVHQLTLSWSSPPVPVSGYRINVLKGEALNPDFSKDVYSESEIAVNLDQLSGNTKYAFSITTLLGESFATGIESNVSATVTTKTGIPSKMNRPICADVGLRTVKVSWQPPADNGGADIISYRITMRADSTTDGGGVFYERIGDTKSTDTSVVIDKLKPDGHVYEFKVEARNEKGASFPSPSSNPVVTQHCTISSPVIALAGKPIGTTAYKLTWDQPPDAGTPVTGYRISYQPDGKGPFQKAPDYEGNLTRGTYDVTELKAGTEYRFRVIAINKIGAGEPTATDLLQTTVDVPAQVEKPSVGFVTDTTCDMEWRKPADHGAEITGYQILMQKGGGGGYTVKVENTGTSDTRTRIQGLTHGGIEYQFKVKAINSVGLSFDGSPATDGIATKYNYQTDTAASVKQAEEEFKLHNKLHDLWKLKMDNERYNKKVAVQNKIVSNTKEQAEKSKKLAMTNQLLLGIEKRMCKKKIDMQVSYSDKTIAMSTDVCAKKKKLDTLKWEKRMELNAKKAELKLVKSVGILMKKIEKVKDEAEEQCGSNLREQASKLQAASATSMESATKRIKDLEDRLASLKKTSKADLVKIEKEWQAKLDDQVVRSKAKLQSLEVKVMGESAVENEKEAVEAAEKAEEAVHSPVKVEMKKLEELRKQLKQASKSEVAEREEQMNKILLNQRKNKNDINEVTKVVQQKSEQVAELTGKLQVAKDNAKHAEEQMAKAGVRRPSMFMDLGESLKKVDTEQKKDLADKLREANAEVKKISTQKETLDLELAAAQQKLEQKQATAKAMQSEIDLVAAQQASAINGTAYQKSHELDVLARNRIQAIENQTAEANKKAEDLVSAEVQPISTLPSLSYSTCENPRVIEDEVIKQFPDSPKPFQKYLEKFTKDAVVKMSGPENIKATDEKASAEEAKVNYLQSCEMQANCRAMGNVSGSCNPETMCSKGTPATGARPCKTCMTLFKLKRWRELNSGQLRQCVKGEECKSTPLVWPLCSRVEGNCGPLDLGASPNKTDDVYVAETHCTSCFEGDALEIVHPGTNTGFCRASGPTDGSARISLPKCYASNAMAAVSKGENQVCTHIQRPYTFFRGTSDQGWLKGYNEFAYVTCNLRKAVVCEAKRDPVDSLEKPASQSLEQTVKESAECQVQTQASCETVCRVKLDGSICKLGDETCKSEKSWTYDEFEHFKTKSSFKNQILQGLDCDPTRCTTDMCKEAIIA